MPPLQSRHWPFVITLCALSVAGCGVGPQSYVNRGNRFAGAGKYTDAALQYQKAIQKAPDFGDAHYRLGLLYLTTNRPVPAYQELKRAVELMPDDDQALATLGKLALTIFSRDPKHPQPLYDQADKAADQLLSNKPDSFDGNLLKGAIALTGVNKRPADAVLFIRKALAVKPEDPDARLGLAQALVQDNRAQDGITLAQESIRKNKAFGPAYDFLYEQYRSAGKTDEAENVLKLKVANNPKQAAFIIELARYYAGRQNPPQVDATVAKLFASPADFPDGRLIAGNFYLSVGKPELALQQFNAGLQSASANRNAYRKRIAPVLASQKKWPEAFQQIEAILKEQPNDRDAKLMRALGWLDEGRPENLDRAVAELQAQSKERPNDAALHFDLGNGLARKGDREGALREWEAATKANRAYLPARFAIAQLYLTQGKTAEALKASEETIAVAPANEEAGILHAVCLTAAGHYLPAREELNRLAARSPQAPQVQFRLAMLDMAEHKYKHAEETFRQIEGAPPNPEVVAGLAQAIQAQGQSARAIRLLQDELKRSPDSPALRQTLAGIAAGSGKFDVAVEQYAQLGAAAPGSTAFQLSLASAYTSKGDSASALGVLEKAARADPKSAPASLMLAHALIAAGRPGEASASYRRVIEVDPNNAMALNDLAYLMADSGDNLDQALAYAQRGLRYVKDPGLGTSLMDTMGWVYLKKNMTDDAVQTFRDLVRSNPENATFHYHLGAALYQKGDRKKARTELEAALAAKPSASDVPRIRDLLARL
jgi:tetratricopeptide (TPR) repeat protein